MSVNEFLIEYMGCKSNKDRLSLVENIDVEEITYEECEQLSEKELKKIGIEIVSVGGVIDYLIKSTDTFVKF